MTQKPNLFKGKKKAKSIPPNRHGKALITRKGKRFLKPTNFTDKMDAEAKITKFINQCNEKKALTLASKDGGRLHIIKPLPEAPAASENTVGTE